MDSFTALNQADKGRFPLKNSVDKERYNCHPLQSLHSQAAHAHEREKSSNQPLHITTWDDNELLANKSSSSSKYKILSKKYKLPKLQIDVVENVEMILSPDGQLIPASNKWLRLDESSTLQSSSISSSSRSNGDVMEMTVRPVMKCKASDPLPLMPSAVQQSVKQQHFSGQQQCCYDEPVIRDRYKDWFMHSQREALGVDIDLSVGKRMRYKSRIGAENGNTCSPPLGTYPKKGELKISPRKLQLIWRGGCTISNVYCILSVIGVGIAGRVFAEGAKQKSRSLLLEAYESDFCALHQAWLSMEDIKRLFCDRPDYLKAGQKKEMATELCSMCQFDEEYATNKDGGSLEAHKKETCNNTKRLVVKRSKEKNKVALLHGKMKKRC